MTSNVLVFSIKPHWVAAILAGRKTFELRRRPPTLAQPTAALIYETSPRCQIRVVCVVGPVITDAPENLWAKVCNFSALSRQEYDTYFGGSSAAHAIVLTEPRELESAISLVDLRTTIGFAPPQSWQRASADLTRLTGLVG